MGSCEGMNQELPTKSDEESCLVEKGIEISNLDMLKCMAEFVKFGSVYPTREERDNV